ncbi:MAG: hypothetical protein EA409_02160 [Saprospirales bacterium]|jgi:hypothetical protein|nr:MAG: hypothetical protein EA409_02160 [Saprospirales bacterium]
MKGLNWISFIALVSFFLSSCAGDPASDLVETDLMRHGLPLKILAPEELTVRTSSLGTQEEFVLDGGDDFYIEVHASEGSSGGMEDLVSDLKRTIEGHRFFQEFTLEQSDGFIYEFKINEKHSNFGFRRVRIQGGREYVFRNAPSKIFTEEQAVRMFNAVGG